MYSRETCLFVMYTFGILSALLLLLLVVATREIYIDARITYMHRHCFAFFSSSKGKANVYHILRIAIKMDIKAFNGPHLLLKLIFIIMS